MISKNRKDLAYLLVVLCSISLAYAQDVTFSAVSTNPVSFRGTNPLEESVSVSIILDGTPYFCADFAPGDYSSCSQNFPIGEHSVYFRYISSQGTSNSPTYGLIVYDPATHCPPSSSSYCYHTPGVSTSYWDTCGTRTPPSYYEYGANCNNPGCPQPYRYFRACNADPTKSIWKWSEWYCEVPGGGCVPGSEVFTSWEFCEDNLCKKVARRCSNYCTPDWSTNLGCVKVGDCLAGETSCDGSRLRSCNYPSCSWQPGGGTDSDRDGIDLQCGDSQCDNVAGTSDSNKESSESSCSDGKDNDCDGAVDSADSNCCICTPDANSCDGNTVRRCNSDCKSYTIIQNCDSSDAWACDGNAKEYRDYYCSGGSCTYSSSSRTDCTTKATEDSDGSEADQHKVAGTVTDYTACSSGECSSNSYSDSCSGTSLTEYLAHTSPSYTSVLKECQEYEAADHICPGDRYYRQEWWCSDRKCQRSGTTTHVGLNSDGDIKDTQCGDSAPCDTVPGIWDSNKQTSEFSCADSLDNDCDGFTDCADTDCRATIVGTIINEKGEKVQGTTAKLTSNGETRSATSGADGSYELKDACNTVTVDLVHPSYESQTSTFTISPPNPYTLNINFRFNCESDCTSTGDSTIHKECRNRGGCSFYDGHVADICDGFRPGQLRHYSDTQYVRCPDGAPQEYTCTSPPEEAGTAQITINRAPIDVVLSSC